MVAGMLVGTFFSFILRIFDASVVNQAGPDWLWMGGRNDVIRNLYFQPDGRFRRFGRVALLLTVFVGSAALYWIAHRL